LGKGEKKDGSAEKDQRRDSLRRTPGKAPLLRDQRGNFNPTGIEEKKRGDVGEKWKENHSRRKGGHHSFKRGPHGSASGNAQGGGGGWRVQKADPAGGMPPRQSRSSSRGGAGGERKHRRVPREGEFPYRRTACSVAKAGEQ